MLPSKGIQVVLACSLPLSHACPSMHRSTYIVLVEVCSTEVYPGHGRLIEYCFAQNCTIQVCSTQICFAEICFFQVRAAEVRIAQVSPSYVRLQYIGIAQICT